MNVAYEHKTKTITISDFGSLNDPVLYIDGSETQHLDVDNTYTFDADGIYQLTVIDATPTTTELGYFLVDDYSKDKNRAYLVTTLDNRTFYCLSELYIKNNKILREIEFSFYSGNLERPEILFKELKFPQTKC